MAGRSVTVWMVLGVVCVAAVLLNLSRMEERVSRASRAEGGGAADDVAVGQPLRRGLPANLKGLVAQRMARETGGMVQALKQHLASDIEAAVHREAASAAALLGQELQARQTQAGSNTARSQVPISVRFPGLGAEDYDEAVGKRVAELEMEERIHPETKHGFFIKFGANPPKWPFNRVTDANDHDTGIVALVAPFTKYYYNHEHEMALFWRLKARGHVMIGVSSYEFFPGNATDPITDRRPQQNPEDKKTYAAMDGWLHCFRNPVDHMPPGVPRILLSQSDYIDPNHPDSHPRGVARKFFFTHSNLGGVWNDFNRNWTVTEQCIKIAVAKQNLPIMLVGKEKDENTTSMKDIMPLVRAGKVHISKMIGHFELTTAMEQSEFMFVPNLSDASPRVAAEALLRDVPVIMNRHIAGGWKYINEQTGVFFDGVDDFWPAVQRLRALRAAGKLRPHDWFSEHYGPRKASFRVQAFLELTVGKERLAKARSLARVAWT